MIALVQGPPGNGKSFYAIRKAAEALENGKCLATNVELAPDAYAKIAARNPLRRFNKRARDKRARQLAAQTLVSENLQELFSIRLRGRGEGRGVMILDEAHNWMNARAWSADDRAHIVRFFSQHRKLGWDVYLIAQDAEMIDKQVRALAEYIVSLRNLRRAKWAGVPISPVNLFLAVWRWHATTTTVVKREAFTLNYAKDLYDTYATSHGLHGEHDDALWLPRQPDPTASAGARGATDGADPARDAAPDPARVLELAALGRGPSPSVSTGQATPTPTPRPPLSFEPPPPPSRGPPTPPSPPVVGALDAPSGPPARLRSPLKTTSTDPAVLAVDGTTDGAAAPRTA